MREKISKKERKKENYKRKKERKKKRKDTEISKRFFRETGKHVRGKIKR